MASIKYNENHKVDEHSQRMLRELADQDDPLGTGDLTRPAGFDKTDYDLVRYRLKQKLKPAGLVRELEPEPRWDTDRLRFEITEDGQQFVENHREQLGALPDISEIANDASVAKTEATSAKESVQYYRGKVSRFDNKIKDFEKRITKTEDQIDDFAGRVDYFRERLPTQSQFEELRQEVESLQTEVRELSREQKETKANLSRKAESDKVVRLEKHLRKLSNELYELQQHNGGTNADENKSHFAVTSAKALGSYLLLGLSKLKPRRRSNTVYDSPQSHRSLLGVVKKLLILSVIIAAAAWFGFLIWIFYTDIVPAIRFSIS